MLGLTPRPSWRHGMPFRSSMQSYRSSCSAATRVRLSVSMWAIMIAPVINAVLLGRGLNHYIPAKQHSVAATTQICRFLCASAASFETQFGTLTAAFHPDAEIGVDSLQLPHATPSPGPPSDSPMYGHCFHSSPLALAAVQENRAKHKKQAAKAGSTG